MKKYKKKVYIYINQLMKIFRKNNDRINIFNRKKLLTNIMSVLDIEYLLKMKTTVRSLH